MLILGDKISSGKNYRTSQLGKIPLFKSKSKCFKDSLIWRRFCSYLLQLLHQLQHLLHVQHSLLLLLLLSRPNPSRSELQVLLLLFEDPWDITSSFLLFQLIKLVYFELHVYILCLEYIFFLLTIYAFLYDCLLALFGENGE